MKKTTTYVWDEGDIFGGRQVVLKKGTHVVGWRNSDEPGGKWWFVTSLADGFTPFEGTKRECAIFLTTENAAVPDA